MTMHSPVYHCPPSPLGAAQVFEGSITFAPDYQSERPAFDPAGCAQPFLAGSTWIGMTAPPEPRCAVGAPGCRETRRHAHAAVGGGEADSQTTWGPALDPQTLLPIFPEPSPE